MWMYSQFVWEHRNARRFEGDELRTPLSRVQEDPFHNLGSMGASPPREGRPGSDPTLPRVKRPDEKGSVPSIERRTRGTTPPIPPRFNLSFVAFMPRSIRQVFSQNQFFLCMSPSSPAFFPNRSPTFRTARNVSRRGLRTAPCSANRHAPKVHFHVRIEATHTLLRLCRTAGSLPIGTLADLNVSNVRTDHRSIRSTAW